MTCEWILKDVRDDHLSILWVIWQVVEVPAMALVSSRNHEENLGAEENPGWLDGRHERTERRQGGKRCSSEGEPEPLDPLTQVVGVRDIRVQIPMRDPIVLLAFRVRVIVGPGLGFALGLGVAPNVEENFVMKDVPEEADGPEGGACPESGTSGEEGGCSVGAEVGAHEGAVHGVEGYGGKGDADVGF